jgi:putative LysE/RhtB family amino acid efflux pump
MLIAFAAGLLLGFVVAMPVGPASMLCMQRTVGDGFAAGLATGFGIATADALWASVVIGGVGLIEEFVLAHARWVTLAGGLLLALIGLGQLRGQGEDRAQHRFASGSRNAVAGFLITLTNPAALLLMAAALTLFGFAEFGTTAETGVMLVLGIYTGSLAWWTLLVSGLRLVRKQLPAKLVARGRFATGLVLVIFGLAVIVREFVWR